VEVLSLEKEDRVEDNREEFERGSKLILFFTEYISGLDSLRFFLFVHHGLADRLICDIAYLSLI
jgi:hypothetical protein